MGLLFFFFVIIRNIFEITFQDLETTRKYVFLIMNNGRRDILLKPIQRCKYFKIGLISWIKLKFREVE